MQKQKLITGLAALALVIAGQVFCVGISAARLSANIVSEASSTEDELVLLTADGEKVGLGESINDNQVELTFLRNGKSMKLKVRLRE